MDLSRVTVNEYIEATELPKYKFHKRESILGKHLLKIKESIEKDEKIIVVYNKIRLDEKSFYYNYFTYMLKYKKDINKVKIHSKFNIIHLFWRQADSLLDNQLYTLNEILKK